MLLHPVAGHLFRVQALNAMVLHLPGAKGCSTKMGLHCTELLLLQIGHDQPFTF